MKTPFTHTNGRLEGTKVLASIWVLVICARSILPLFGNYPEMDPSLATGVLAALLTGYTARQYTRTRYESVTKTTEGESNEKAAFDALPPGAR